ncbi:MAG: signal peptidase II [Candidatus Parcubacteria bacterium]|nr:signal peptidase II [Candidatus Parcubacteria bacterium]
MAKFKKIVLLVSLSFDLFILESLIKYYFLNKVPKEGFYFFSQSRPWPGKFIQIIFTPNQNVAFSLPLPQILTIVFVIFILIVLSYIWIQNLLRNNLWGLTAVSLIILGALSNLIDRLIFGFVIDYINIFIWPVFNLADVMIVVGVILYIFSEFKKKPKPIASRL